MNDLQKQLNTIADAYPVIGKKIELFWGHQEFTDLLRDLFHNSRDHIRDGFAVPVASALMDLQEEHDQQFPHLMHPTPNTRSLEYRQKE